MFGAHILEGSQGRRASLVTLWLLTCAWAGAQQHLAPGVERWAIKTSVVAHPQRKSASLQELLSLPDPIDHEERVYDTTRIAVAVGPHNLREGQMVTTTGWIHLVALEDDSRSHRDGDYHIQIRNSPTWSDSCLIIEVPLREFVADPDLGRKCGEVRDFVRLKLLNGKEPGTRGNILEHPVFVRITGQLFFDLPHVKGLPRGRRLMKSYTPWEIHPVTSMRFARPPK
jgi:hypothetical protein